MLLCDDSSKSFEMHYCIPHSGAEQAREVGSIGNHVCTAPRRVSSRVWARLMPTYYGHCRLESRPVNYVSHIPSIVSHSPSTREHHRVRFPA